MEIKRSGILICLSLALSASVFPAWAKDVPDGSITDRQWVVFDVNPKSAIIYVDTLAPRSIRDGVLQVLLPAGEHKFLVESPFYEEQRGSFILNRDRFTEVRLTLEPRYGLFHTVSPEPDAAVYVDCAKVGVGRVKKLRLMEGEHSVMLVRDSLCLYESKVNIVRNSNNRLEISDADIEPKPLAAALAAAGLKLSDLGGDQQTASDLDSPGWTSISLKSNVRGATVLLNGIVKDVTPCVISPVRAGQVYRLTLRYPACSDVSVLVTPEPKEINTVNVRMKKKK